jgi:hypothetical protein
MLLAIAALTASSLATNSADAISVSRAEMAAAVTRHIGTSILAKEIRRISCKRIEEEGTEATCTWEQHEGKRWRRYTGYIAGARDGIQLIDEPVPASLSKRSSVEDAQFRRWLIQYLKNATDDDDLPNLVYGYALVDLNGDGRNEAVVWASDSRICGTGGCNLDVFVYRKSRWRLFSSTTITRPPIKLLVSRHLGWRDLAAWEAGGGIERPYEGRLRFNGTGYEPVEPVDWTGVHPRPPQLHGLTLIKDASIALFPSKCRRTQEAASVFGPMPIRSGKPGSC